MAGKGSLSAKGKMTRGQLREKFTEQLIRAVDSRNFVGELFLMLDEIKDPKDRLKCGVELLKFAMPQLSAQKIEVTTDETPVQRIIFAPSAMPMLGKPKE